MDVSESELKQVWSDLEASRLQLRAAADALRFGRRYHAQAVERLGRLVQPIAEGGPGNNGSRSSEQVFAR
jgi:hypothetical protein